MKQWVLSAAAFVVFGLGVSAGALDQAPGTSLPLPASPSTPAAAPDPAGPDAQNAVVKQYCAGCHSERGKAGGL